ncbi:death domain-associated protein 6 [Betta splendens]|uniref:Death domain-associated protein 6 n=1 Tax=Betta splendens TaxID=158456 RepID=A0A6P7P0B6_BETSP|nr:death domain-associated protein 6 [Betta splendens]
MAVAPASMADKIIVLDDDDDDAELESPQASRVFPNSSSEHQNKIASPVRAQQSVPTHVTQSPFASTKKSENVLEAENQRLFAEFVAHCSPFTEDCPEVLTFLQTKHEKASPEYLLSVEFRNTLGRCLTRVQAKHSKTFVYINELCTVLKQHAAKKRQTLTKVDLSTSSSSSPQSTSVMPKNKEQVKGKTDDEKEEKPAAEDEQPSTSGLQEDNNESNQTAERKAKRASRKQIAYLENLLKVYNDEIFRLQNAELSLDDLEAEDSLYIQEHKLKRKMMKIYDKLCELKGCSTRTGRVIEQRIRYEGTRYPEINKRIERFINSPEARMNPPDYQDIHQLVLRMNERHNLCLIRKQLNQIAEEAFRETAKLLQERRQLDLAFNFGSRLTDPYKPTADPALSDPSLLRQLRSNREVALSRLEEVITKYATKQEDAAELERQKRLEKSTKGKEGNKSGEGADDKEVNGAAEEEDEDEDDEEDESSDPDIEDDIKASTQQEGADDDDDDDDEEDDSNEVEQADDAENKEDQADEPSGSVSAAEEASVKDDDDEPVTSGVSPLSDGSKSQTSALSDPPSSTDSPSQSEPMQTDLHQGALSNGSAAGPEELLGSSNPDSDTLEHAAPPVVANGVSSHTPPAVTVEKCSTQTTSGTSPPPGSRTTRSHKRKREDQTSDGSKKTRHTIICDNSDVDIPLDMGVVMGSSPPESTQADSPTQQQVSSSQTTPPPKKNKVNVATQCDPDEIIVLSDSE